MGYQGNSNLRCANDKIVYTPEMKKEFIRCYSDILHFGENYCYIINLDEGKVKIKFWDFQKRLIKAMYDPPEYRNSEGGMEKKKFVIVASSRQIGKCVFFEEKIKIKNKKTGEIKEISIGEFHDMIKNKK